MADAPKISGMTLAAVSDLGATTSAIEVSIGIGSTPATRGGFLGTIRDWLAQVGLVAAAAPVTVAHAASPYAVLASDQSIWVNTSAGVVTVTLPAAPTAGRILNIKKITTDGNALTIARNGKSIEFVAADLVTSSAARPNYTLQYDATSGSWGIL